MSGLLKIINKSALKASNAFLLTSAKCSTSAPVENLLCYDKDPGKHFMHPQTQKLLKSMTRLRLDKVYRKRAVLNNKVEYKFMTTEQIENAIKAAIKKTDALLQMPPIVQIQEEAQKIISTDPALQSFDQSDFIFTDITFGVKDTERTIVVRRPDGTLENAGADARKRMNQIYFPHQGRSLRQPRLFEPAYLAACMAANEYEFILDRACVQYEPYEREFHRVTQLVYEHVNESKRFDVLRSTRHFGPMCFYLAWHGRIDDLLVDMIDRDYLQNAVELIMLAQKLAGSVAADEQMLQRFDAISVRRRTDLVDNSLMAIGKGDLQQEIGSRVGKTIEDLDIDDVCSAFVEAWSRKSGIKKLLIEKSLFANREANDAKRKLLDGLQKAHGIN